MFWGPERSGIRSSLPATNAKRLRKGALLSVEARLGCVFGLANATANFRKRPDPDIKHTALRNCLFQRSGRFHGVGCVSTAIIYFAMPLGIALHENIMVAATVAIGAFVFRPRQLIGYDRLRSQPA
jgi:hypothetical protein